MSQGQEHTKGPKQEQADTESNEPNITPLGGGWGEGGREQWFQLGGIDIWRLYLWFQMGGIEIHNLNLSFYGVFWRVAEKNVDFMRCFEGGERQVL